MKWVLEHLNDQLQTWQLSGHELTIELKYNCETHVFRLHAGERRLFFLEKTGFVQTKLLLKTEYSIVIGEIHFFKNWNSGVAIIDDHKYHYSFKQNSLHLQSFGDDEQYDLEIDNRSRLDQFNLAALIFSTCRILNVSLELEEPTMAW